MSFVMKYDMICKGDRLTKPLRKVYHFIHNTESSFSLFIDEFVDGVICSDDVKIIIQNVRSVLGDRLCFSLKGRGCYIGIGSKFYNLNHVLPIPVWNADELVIGHYKKNLLDILDWQISDILLNLVIKLYHSKNTLKLDRHYF